MVITYNFDYALSVLIKKMKLQNKNFKSYIDGLLDS